MSLVDLIRKNESVRAATAIPATHKPENTGTVARIATVAVANITESKTDTNTDSDIEKIRTWLFKIGEPESDHFLVIDKCKSDSQVLDYFLKHAHGEFEPGYAVTDERRADDRVKCSDCLFLFGGYCQRYTVTNNGVRYRPVQDVLKRCSEFKPRL